MSLTERDELILTGLWPTLAKKAITLIQVCAQNQILIGIQSGLRTWEEQDELYSWGRTKLNPNVGAFKGHPLGGIATQTKAGESWHNYGLAFDVYPRDKTLKWSGPGECNEWELKMGETGENIGLTWGGRWKNTKDAPHFQICGDITKRLAQELYSKGSHPAVWYAVEAFILKGEA